MRTAIISDLHLGLGTSADLLRDAEVREALAPQLEAADRIVLLGDALELRDLPLAAVLDLARPVLAWLGELVGDGELVVVPGNHDHHLVAPWLERRTLAGAGSLGLEEVVDLPEGPVRELLRSAEPARVSVSYPGVWVRPGVYATHGHYLDRHMTIPTMERLGVALVERLLGISPQDAAAGEAIPRVEAEGASEYEQVQTPVYEFLFALAQATLGERRGGAGPSLRAWQLLSGRDTRAARIRGWLLGSVALPGAVGVANRLGFGPVRSDLSPAAITEAGLAAIGAVIERLGIDAEHVIFGHTHRRGPLPGDSGWAAGGARLWNTGSWVFSPALTGAEASRSPYWPGTVALVDEDGPPKLMHVLDDWGRGQLKRATAP